MIAREQPLITPAGRIKAKLWLQDRFPRGAFRTSADARQLTERAIEILSFVLLEERSPVRLDIEIAPNIRAAGSGAAIRSLVIFSGKQTFTTPLAVTQSLIHLNGEPLYVSHPEGASMLLDAIIGHAEAKLTDVNKA